MVLHGPGFMFIYASMIYAVGTVLVASIPPRVPGEVGATSENEIFSTASADLEEPLLLQDESHCK